MAADPLEDARIANDGYDTPRFEPLHQPEIDDGATKVAIRASCSPWFLRARTMAQTRTWRIIELVVKGGSPPNVSYDMKERTCLGKGTGVGVEAASLEINQTALSTAM